MADLREFRSAVSAVGVVTLFRRTWRSINDDDLFTLAAALAYSWLFAIFPFLIFVLTLVPYIPKQQKDYVQHQIADTVRHTFPKDGAATLLDSLNQVLNQPQNGLLSIGLVLTLWAASGGVSMTMAGLDTVFDVKKRRPIYTQRPLAILLTIIISLLILLVVVLLPVGTGVLDWLGRSKYLAHEIIWALNFVRYGISILLMLCVLALIYRFGTAAKQKLTFISPGAIFSIVVWTLLAICFNSYINHFSRYEKTYGTVGGVAILLLVFYVDALVLLIGAEINAELDRTMQSAPQLAESSSPNEPSTSSTTGLIVS